MSKPAPPQSRDEQLQKLSRADLIEYTQIASRHEAIRGISARVLKLIKHQDPQQFEDTLTALLRHLQSELLHLEARDMVLEEKAGIGALSGSIVRASDS